MNRLNDDSMDWRNGWQDAKPISKWAVMGTAALYILAGCVTGYLIYQSY